MTPDDTQDLLFVDQMPFCVDYKDEYYVTLTSFGPTPNRVRQYLRQRFTYSLAEVMVVRVPLPLLRSNDLEAEVLVLDLESLGSEVQVLCKPGGPDDGSQQYPRVRVGFAHKV
jgi:hypothetical protein